MPELELLTTLAGGLAAALVLGYVSHRLGLSPIVGYLLAGIAVGPNTPGFVANPELAASLAEIGVILLMFGVGLHFDVKELLSVQRIALPGAILQILTASLLGLCVGLIFGWSVPTSILFGLTISVASTVVLTRVLSDANQLHTTVGNIAVGWLVVQDLLAVLGLVLLPPLIRGESTGFMELSAIVVFASLKIGLVIAGIIFLGGWLIPWLLKHVVATRSRELFTLTILVVALCIAVISANLFGVSIALGSFLAGMVVGRSDFSIRAATEAMPMRDAFAVLFFVSVGILFDPKFIVERPMLVASTLAVVLIGTPLVTFTLTLTRGYSCRTSLILAFSLAQIGEFSFILATLGRELTLFSDDAVNAVVAAAIVSISINPMLYRLVDPLEAWISKHPSILRWARRFSPRMGAEPTSFADEIQKDDRHRAVIVGYGPVGQTLGNLLRKNEIEPTIIEMNLDTIKVLRTAGLDAVYGDAIHVDTLTKAGIEQASTLILSASVIQHGVEIIRVARELNPRLRILVRVSYLRERAVYYKAGANDVFAGEGEVALAMTESILISLGATPDQIDGERELLRSDLFGSTGRLSGVLQSDELGPNTISESRSDEQTEKESSKPESNSPDSN